MPAIPEILKDPKLLQLVFAKLAQETARAEAEKEAKLDAQSSRNEWKAIAAKESERANLLEKANTDRRDESTQLRMSNGFLQTSVGEYKDEVKDLRSEVNSLRSRQKWLLVGGAVVGAGVCTAVVRRP